jgi:hypothetical protein
MLAALIALTFITQVAAFVFAASIFVGAFGVLWRVPLTQKALRFVGRQFGEPIVNSVRREIREIVHEETADLRAQLYPNGGSSLADKINRMRLDVYLVRTGLEDVKNRLEAMHPTGEIPTTTAMKQPQDLQV